MNRWIAGLLAIAVIVAVAYLGWDKIQSARMQLKNEALLRENSALLKEKEELVTHNRKLKLAVTMLTFEERRAYLRIVQVTEGDKPQSVVHWIEVDKDGDPIGETQERQLIGMDAFVNARVIAFTDDFIMEEDPLKGQALVVFNKIYGSSQALDDVEPLELCSPYESLGDEFGFEKKMWRKFNELASSRFESEQYGVRYAQHTSVGKPVVAGVTYKVIVRATGEISIVPLDEEEAQKVEFPPSRDINPA